MSLRLILPPAFMLKAISWTDWFWQFISKEELILRNVSAICSERCRCIEYEPPKSNPSNPILQQHIKRRLYRHKDISRFSRYSAKHASEANDAQLHVFKHIKEVGLSAPNINYSILIEFVYDQRALVYRIGICRILIEHLGTSESHVV